MAIQIKNTYSGRTDNTDPNYPYGKGRNVVGGVEGTGTPFEADWYNNLEGFLQGLLLEADITPDGQVDNANNSQLLEAVKGLEKIASKVVTSDGRNVQERLDDLPSEVDAAGTAEGLINVHNSDATAHPELRSFITYEADRAEAAADAASLSASVYEDTASGLASTVDGEYFNVVSSDDENYLDLYKNESGVAVYKKSYPTTEVLEEVKVEIEERDNFLGSSGMAVFTGASDLIPVLSDSDLRLIMWFDKEKQRLDGLGIGDNYARDFNQASYSGSDYYALLTDASGRVLVGYDPSRDEIVGAGLNKKFDDIDDAINNIAIGSTYLFTEKTQLALKPITKSINQIVSYGQSLSIGAKGEPVISTTQPYSNLTFAGGPRAYDGSAYSFAPLKPLVENAGGSPDGRVDRGETICSGWANYTNTLLAIGGVNPANFPTLASAAGRGGYRIDQLNKASTWYNNVLLEHIQQANDIDSDHAVNVITWIQGETDIDDGTTYATYKALLSQLVNDFDTDGKAITGQTTPVFVLEYQLSYGTLVTDAISKSHMEVAEENDHVFVVTPTYHLPHFTDETHLTNVGYKIMGGYFAKSYKDILDGYEPKCLKPISATMRDKVISIKMDVPVLPLKLDLTNIKSTEDYGFYVEDSNGKVSIDTMEIDGDNVVITLLSTPVGNTEVRYGYDYAATSLGIKDGASGNLRDSDPRTIEVNSIEYQLFNVSTHFKLDVIKLGE